MSDLRDGVEPEVLGPLDRPVASAGIVGLSATTASKLAKGLGVYTVRDLLEQVPRRYLDLSSQRSIGDLKIGEDVTVTGKVARIEGRYVRSKRHLLTVTITDRTGYLSLVWWNQPFRGRALAVGAEVVVAGRVERGRGRLSISNPFIERLDSSGGGGGVHVGRIIPIHPATQGVTATQIRRYVHEALRRYGDQMPEPVPREISDRMNLMPRVRAIRELHFPSSDAARFAARHRLAFEELLVLSAGLAMRKRRLEQRATGIEHHCDDRVDRFLASLPFAPTGAQQRSIGEIASDMASPQPMNRLLQGEVGSGKTVVAVAAALVASASGSQTAFMAPTEVLAEQHYLSVTRVLEPLRELAPSEGRLFGDGFGVYLLTGSTTGKDRKRALDAAASGEAMMLVGTHALIQEGVEFDRLGLAIVDEQHRFGVHQRVSLRTRGKGDAQPDALIMTATPIPRTLALTLYGDLDVSTLDEMPAGRTPIRTSVVSDDGAREAAYQHIREEVAAGRQAFVVCPLVEESSSLEAKAAETEFERIKTEVFPAFRVGLIHGRLKSQVKEEVMKAMRAGEIDVLVATTVIEVGVDIPNATVMVIEDAGRFGLSQLHQLRGRIGRGHHAAACYLFTAAQADDDDARSEASRRLEAMASTTDGFRLAELDLEIRGTGQLFGRGSLDDGKGAPLQAGRGDLQFANLLRDVEVLVQARTEAFAIVDRDPTLAMGDHRALSDEVRRRFADRLDWLFAS